MKNRPLNGRSVLIRVRKAAISGVAAAALAVGPLLPNNVSAQASDGELKRFILIGLCEPADDSPETLAGFNEWYVNQHVEDVAHGPNFVRGRVYGLRGQHLSGPTYTDYISVYEVDAPSWEEAERALNEWQGNPDAWEGRAKHTETGQRVGNVLSCPGSGWYELLGSWDGPAKAATKND
jgi:hypothetical protein